MDNSVDPPGLQVYKSDMNSLAFASLANVRSLYRSIVNKVTYSKENTKAAAAEYWTRDLLIYMPMLKPFGNTTNMNCTHVYMRTRAYTHTGGGWLSNYRIVQNFDRGNFDGYWLFKYLMEENIWWMVTVFHHTPVGICCTVFKQFDGLNFDGLAGKRQNFPSSKFSAIR